MNRCMRECDRQRASTIVFPAIGTGNLGFPVETAAHIMVDEVCNYLQKNKCKSLSMVYFIIFIENMYRTFCDKLEQRKKATVTVPLTNVSSSKDKEKMKSGQRRARRLEESLNILPPNRYRGQQGIETITSKAGNQSLDLRNGITVEILKGDITAEKTDVIVNTTNRQMILMGGGVSAAFAKKAGAELQRACDEIKPEKKQCLEQGKVLDTRPGNLQCKRVFHTVYQKNFVTIIRSCIERAVEFKYTSIAFPGIGTGAEGCPADTAAKEMIKGLQQCTTTYSMHVRIVLFQDEVYKAFRAVIDLQLTWAGRAVKSLIPWSPAYEEDEEAMDIDVPENEDTELRIFGETEEQVLSAENSLNTLIKKQFTTVEIEDDRICLLHEIQETDLELKARRMQIVFHIDRNLSSIELKGSKESIAEMKLKILDALNKAEKEASRKTQAETMMQTVKWVRQDSSETQYDPVTNLEIEAASRSGNSTYKFTDAVSGENFTINFKEMVEIDHTMGDKKFYVQRVVEGKQSWLLLTGAEGGLPNDWEPMVDPTSKKQVPLHVVDLTVASRGYKFALAEFHKTMTQGTNYKAIVKIERIQNPGLYGQYAVKKAQLDAHNPKGVQNERWLFHGTKESSVAKINKTNFNRSFRGQNGMAYSCSVT